MYVSPQQLTLCWGWYFKKMDRMEILYLFQALTSKNHPLRRLQWVPWTLLIFQRFYMAPQWGHSTGHTANAGKPAPGDGAGHPFTDPLRKESSTQERRPGSHSLLCDLSGFSPRFHWIFSGKARKALYPIFNKQDAGFSEFRSTYLVFFFTLNKFT